MYLDRYDKCVDAPIKIGNQEGCALMLSQMSGKNTAADKTGHTHKNSHVGRTRVNLSPPNVDDLIHGCGYWAYGLFFCLRTLALKYLKKTPGLGCSQYD